MTVAHCFEINLNLRYRPPHLSLSLSLSRRVFLIWSVLRAAPVENEKKLSITAHSAAKARAVVARSGRSSSNLK